MKAIILSALLLGCFATTNAQISEKQLKPFVLKGHTLAGTSGDGFEKSSGDMLLELASNEPDDNEKLVLLRNEKGKLEKIAENPGLLMGKDMLGVSGGNYPSLSGKILSADYTLGSNSSQSDVSIKFEKNKDGQYYFKDYTSTTRNYGVENLFARQKITAAETGKINFSEANENEILKKANTNASSGNADEAIYEAAKQYAIYIPKDFQLAAFATGDLNMDSYKKDLLLVLYNEGNCNIRLLLQQSNGSYRTTQTNAQLIAADETFNSKNLKAVIKNGFFTLEQRVAISDNDFDHRYTTFKYDATQKNWFLHRFDVEHYSGFNPKPLTNTIHLTKNEFGTVSFQNMDELPGIYRYEPALSVVIGTLIKKQFYGRPNYGETPEKDEKVWVYILKLDYPVSVVAETNQPDPEIADKTITNISEIQIYSTGPKTDFKNFEGKKINLQGTFQSTQTGHHYTKVLLKVTGCCSGLFK